ncbi:MAG: hypothetical protein R3A52_16505 [Polyangiales bacterium]
MRPRRGDGAPRAHPRRGLVATLAPAMDGVAAAHALGVVHTT